MSGAAAFAAAPYSWRRERRLMGVVFLAAFSLYAYTTARYVCLEDDSLFIGAMHFFGVSHPPGYPAHTLLGGIFYHLIPFGSPAFKAHLFSGFAAALACVALYVVIRMLSVGRAVAVFAALAFAASRDFWSQAIIAEVYTLNAFLFFAVVALCLGYAAGERKLIFFAAAVFGVGMANHYPLLFLSSAGLLILIAEPLRRRPQDIVFCAVIAVVVAAPFYLWMVWRSHGDAVYNFYGAIEDVEGFRYYFLREGYAEVDEQVGADWRDKWEFFRDFSVKVFWQFTPFGFFLAVVGFFAMAFRRRRAWLALTLGFLMCSVLLIFLLNFNAGVLAFAIFRPYPLPAYGVMAVWMAFGAEALVSRISAAGWRRAGAASLVALVAAASLAQHWRENNRRDYRWTHDFALTRLSEIPVGGILFTHGDLDLPLGYLHYIENVRPDILLYSDQGLTYANRLYGPLLSQTAPEDEPDADNKEDVLVDFFRARLRPIYYRSAWQHLFDKPSPNFDVTGFFHRTRRDAEGRRYILRGGVRRWAEENLEKSFNLTDVWTRYHMRGALSHIAITAFNASQGGLALSEEWRDLIRRTRERYPLVRVNMSDYLVRNGKMSEDEMRAELAWAQALDAKRAEFYDEEFTGLLYALRAALIAELDGDESPDYAPALRRALSEFPSALDNPALEEGLLYYLKTGDDCAFAKTLAAFYPKGAPEQWREKTPTQTAADCADEGLFGGFFRGGVK